MIGVLVDESEARRFVEWLPGIKWNEAFVVMLLIRSKMLKKKYGFKGSDHMLRLEIVPGYHSFWKRRLLNKIKRFAVLAYYSEDIYEYVRYKPGTRIPDEMIPVPELDKYYCLCDTDLVDEVAANVRDAIDGVIEYIEWRLGLREAWLIRVSKGDAFLGLIRDDDWGE